jgi:outer membrane protein assembly factor BamA
VGVDVRFDTRDEEEVPTRGLLLQGTWDRYAPISGPDIRFDQVDLDAYGYVPLGGAHRLAARASVTLTRSRSDVSVPAYLLPTVGGAVVPGWARGRFVAPDRLLASALYRFPLLHYDRLVTVGGHVGIHVAGVYDRLGDQFAPTISFDDPSLRPGDRPLRPSASLGARFAMPRRPHTTLELAVGVSPEGVSAVRFSFGRPLQALRPPHHTSAPLR